jgi:hypothetical protein
MSEYRDPLADQLLETSVRQPGTAGAYVESTPYRDPVVTPTPTSAPPTTGSGVEQPESASMKDKAADSAQVGKQAAGEVAQTAADRAKDVAHEAKTQARNVVGQAQDQLREQASTQHRSLVNNLRSLGDQLTSMADRSEESGQAIDLVSEAGSRAHSVASWLDEREPGQLVDEVRSFARRKPGVFVLGALAAGVVAGRLTRGVVAIHRDGETDSSPGAPSNSRATSYGFGEPVWPGEQSRFEARAEQLSGGDSVDPRSVVRS